MSTPRAVAPEVDARSASGARFAPSATCSFLCSRILSPVDLRLVTPLVLTFNEEANLGRTLDRLRWAERVVVLDSHSTDGTLAIAARFPNADVVQRPFDDFATQANFGLAQVDTPWVLSLDADYVCPPELADEIAALPEDPPEAGFLAAFRYCIYGRPIRCGVYPPRAVLYRRAVARYEQDGHAHRVRLDGSVGRLRAVIDHDDRKPLEAWFRAQQRYAREEAEKLLAADPARLGRVDRLRLRTPLAPVLAPAYVLFARGGLLDGRAGWFYALQRTFAEIALALALYERRHAAPAAVPTVPQPIPLDAP